MEHSGPGVTTPSDDAPFSEGRPDAEDVSLAAKGTGVLSSAFTGLKWPGFTASPGAWWGTTRLMN